MTAIDTNQMIQFSIVGTDGKSHQYVAPYMLAGDEGIDVSLWFLANMGSLATSLLPVLKGAIETWAPTGSVKDIMDKDLGELWGILSQGITAETLAGASKELRAALLSKEAKHILRALFRGVARDGVPMSDPVFAMAYRGNWFELYTAAWRIVAANGFFPSLGTLTSGPE